MKPFDYFAPATLADATRICDAHGAAAKLLAGGTDLLIRLKRKVWVPRAIVSLRRIAGLRDLTLNGELRIGALTTLNDVLRSPMIRAHFPVLAQTASKMAGVQVRSLATVVGNVCNASPAADMAPPLIALNARAVVVGKHGERVIPLDEFFVGVGQSALAPDELVKEILVPHPDENTHVSYVKLEHREAMDIAIVGVAVGTQIANRKSQIASCDDVRIVLGAVAPTPMRAIQAEALLRGQSLTPALIAEAARVAANAAKPIDDVRGSAWYRREMVEVLTRRQLSQLVT
jgi:carbon-monoxide dehydrogenase medium subunit